MRPRQVARDRTAQYHPPLCSVPQAAALLVEVLFSRSSSSQAEFRASFAVGVLKGSVCLVPALGEPESSH